MRARYTSHSSQVLHAVDEAIAKALETVGGMAESDVKIRITRNRSVVTGNLRNSITHQPVDEHTMAVGTNVEYAPYVELGTSRARAKPYLANTIQENQNKYRAVIANELSVIG